MTHITTRPGTVMTRTRLNVREGQPSTAAPKLRQIEAGQKVSVIGETTGQTIQGMDLWYALEDDSFIWSGGCEGFVEAEDEAAVTRPSRAEIGDYAPPLFETAPGIRHAARGKRPHGLEGLIVHFDAYRIKAAGNGADDSDRRALDTLRGGQTNGYHYGAISRSGRIFLPEGFTWDSWGYHAGVSSCPVTGRSGVSQFYVGFELNNPGKLFPTADPKVFCPWFNVVLNAKKQPVLDSKGRATRRSANDEWYADTDVRHASGGNIKDGWYLPYSFAQLESLTNVVIYLARRFPGSFKIDQVLGHDEVAPTRKNDPGGAMGDPAEVMTMADYRAFVKTRI